jgi:hypothetical protein
MRNGPVGACLNQRVTLRATTVGVCSIARLPEEDPSPRECQPQADFPSSARGLATAVTRYSDCVSIDLRGN